MFDADVRYIGEFCPEFEDRMTNAGSAAGPAPWPRTQTPSLEATVLGFQLGLMATVAAYELWREACRWNPVLAPFVR